MDHLVDNFVSVRYAGQLGSAKAHVIEVAPLRKEIGMPERPGELFMRWMKRRPGRISLPSGFSTSSSFAPIW
jgi:hypothetical protein